MKISYTAQKRNLEDRRPRFPMLSRSGVLFMPDRSTPHQIKKKIEETHPGFYAAFWLRVKESKTAAESALEIGVTTAREFARKSSPRLLKGGVSSQS